MLLPEVLRVVLVTKYIKWRSYTLRTGLLTSILLVGSEVIKELPATLILRPFNFETLAVSAYNYASEERMYEAAAPSIAIVIVGLLPIIILSRMIKNSRPGETLW